MCCFVRISQRNTEAATTLAKFTLTILMVADSRNIHFLFQGVKTDGTVAWGISLWRLLSHISTPTTVVAKSAFHRVVTPCFWFVVICWNSVETAIWLRHITRTIETPGSDVAGGSSPRFVVRGILSSWRAFPSAMAGQSSTGNLVRPRFSSSLFLAHGGRSG